MRSPARIAISSIPGGPPPSRRDDDGMAHQSGSGGRAASSSIGIPGSGLATVETRAPQREERQPRSAQGAAVRSNAIDILRAVAVLLVLGRHLAPCPESVSPTLHALTSVWHWGGWVGVDMFFVLRSAYATYWLVYFPLYLCG